MKKLLPIITVLLLLLSCKSENINDRSPGLIQVSVADASYESEETLAIEQPLLRMKHL